MMALTMPLNTTDFNVKNALTMNANDSNDNLDNFSAKSYELQVH